LGTALFRDENGKHLVALNAGSGRLVKRQPLFERSTRV
jgi:hypothetical protein